jgi:hypothetical protein
MTAGGHAFADGLWNCQFAFDPVALREAARWLLFRCWVKAAIRPAGRIEDSMREVTICGAQLRGTRDVADNTSRILHAIQQAGERKADLLLTPEGFLSPPRYLVWVA